MPTPEQIRANRRAIAAGRKYGYPQERGPAGQALDESKKRFGAFTGEGRGYQVQISPDGTVMWKVDNQENRPGRVEEYGTDWFRAPEWAQRSYNNPNRQAFFADNPNASWEDFKMKQGLDRQIKSEGLVQDPATGYWSHPGETGYARTAAGVRVGDDGKPLTGSSMTDWMGPWQAQTPAPTDAGTPPWEDPKPTEPTQESGVKSSSFNPTDAAPAPSSGNFQGGFFAGSSPSYRKKRKNPADPYNPFEA
jgi:hypothetical protein